MKRSGDNLKIISLVDLNQIISFCSIELTTMNVYGEYSEDSELDEIYHDEIEGDNYFFEFQLIFLYE